MTLNAVRNSGGRKPWKDLVGCAFRKIPVLQHGVWVQLGGWSQDQRKVGAVALIQTRQTVPRTVMGRAGMKGGAVLGGKAGGS